MDRPVIVARPRQDRNYIIAELLAFQQAVAIQRANVDQNWNDKPGPRSSLRMLMGASPT